MNFITKRRKPPIVPIVSLIDILAILLIFFIATSTFKQPKLGVDIEPPQPGTLTTRPVEDTRTTLAVTADNQIFLGRNEQAITAGALLGELSAARAAGTKLELKADEGADFGVIVKALDALKKAGYKKGDYPTILKVAPGPNTNPDTRSNLKIDNP
jgi:biopolymer transport protein ExbD